MSRVAIVGSGNWGSTIAKIVGHNVKQLKEYHTEVRMWVYEEIVNGEKLSEIINVRHENVNYLPGIKLSENVVAEPNLVKAVEGADVLVFVLPHQFLSRTLAQIQPNVKPTACAVSLIKGLAASGQNGISLLSDMIREKLSITCTLLMGANLASEVSQELYCEATLACHDTDLGNKLRKLFQTDYFRIVTIKDEVGTELCGALKNIIAVGAGIVEGLGYGDNTKAAVIRLGFMEMKRFMYQFFGERNIEEGTFLESCGVADLITTCYGGRNKQMGNGLATTSLQLEDLEKQRLKGQSAQGPITASEVYMMLEPRNLLDTYPLFTMVHRICQRQLPANSFLSCLQNHPEHR